MGLPEVFKVLSDPIRRDILQALRNNRLTAGEIAEQMVMSPAAISYHLNKLKKADLIRESKYKNFIIYELNASIFEEVILWFTELQGGADNNEKSQ